MLSHVASLIGLAGGSGLTAPFLALAGLGSFERMMIRPKMRPQRSPVLQVKTADPLTASRSMPCRTFPLATDIRWQKNLNDYKL